MFHLASTCYSPELSVSELPTVSKTTFYNFSDILNNTGLSTNAEDREPVVSKKQFEKELNKFLSCLKWTNKSIKNAIKLIEEYDTMPNKEAFPEEHLKCVRKFEVLIIGNDKFLIKRRKTDNSPIVRVVSAKEYYDILDKAHIDTEHGDMREMKLVLKSQHWMPLPVIELFCKLCTICQKLQNTHDMDLAELFADRGKIEFVDMRKKPDGNYAWVLHYKDLKTHFTVLRPLVSKDANEISTELLKIFLQYGWPSILEPGDTRDRKFISDLIGKLEIYIPGCKILNGTTSSEKIGVQHTPIDQMLIQWMSENNSKNWSKGVYFTEFYRNSFFRRGNVSPFKAFIKKCRRTGITISVADNLPIEIKTEEEYAKYCNSRGFKPKGFRVTELSLNNQTANPEIIQTGTMPRKTYTRRKQTEK